MPLPYGCGDGSGPDPFVDLRMVFQPVVDIASGALFGAEALLRGPDPGFSPHLVLRNARQAGLLSRLHVQVYAQSLDWARGHLAADQMLFVNVEPDVVGSDDLETALRQTEPVRRGQTVLEVTERWHSASPTWFATLATYRSWGFGVAWDDIRRATRFALRKIASSTANFVKVDLRAILDLAPAERAAVLDRIVTAAHRNGARLIAEGIETPADLELIRRFGIHLAQGFLLARPATALPAPADIADRLRLPNKNNARR